MNASKAVRQQADDFTQEIVDLLHSDQINPGEYMELGLFIVRMQDIADLLEKYEIKMKWGKAAYMLRAREARR